MYVITFSEGNNIPLYENHEFVVGIFSPKKRSDNYQLEMGMTACVNTTCGIIGDICYSLTHCHFGILVGHSVIWYKLDDKENVISFAPPNNHETCKNACCCVQAQHDDIASVHNQYTSAAVTHYNKKYYKISYTNREEGIRKVSQLDKVYNEINIKNPRYKGLSTLLCLDFCCLKGIKYNCTSILIRVFPELGLESDLNHPLAIFILNVWIAFISAYLIALFHQIVIEQNHRTTAEIVGVTFASLTLGINILYMIYNLTLFCRRPYCNRKLTNIPWFKNRALTRDYSLQKIIALLNLLLGLLSLISLVDCTCPRKDHLKTQTLTFDIAISISFVTIGLLILKTFCLDCANGTTNPTALGRILDRAVISTSDVQQPFLSDNPISTQPINSLE